MKKYLLLICVSLSILSCKKDKKIDDAILNLEVDVKVERFDKKFAEAKPKDIGSLKANYPFMFSKRYTDEFWIDRLKDPIQIELNEETQKVFPNLKVEEEEITLLYKHLKHNYPHIKIPRVITATSTVDYRNKVIVTDTIVLISIDTYLGEKHFFYDALQHYIKANMKPEQMVVDLSNAYAEQFIFQPKRKTLLDEMVYYGKQLYFNDKMIPFKTDAQKIGYTEAQYDWAKVNEPNVWKYFVERELLYSTDAKLPNQFINPAPFSKFYLEEVDADSPGKIGRYVGWQIVKSYMENNDTSLEKLLETDAETIFNASRYKPQL
jgi:gliding motility-associated lipoprotein GldB